MKTIFDKTTRDELINRINTLNGNSTAQWGKMNVYQMLKHCTLWEEMISGKIVFKRVFLGRLFGKIALRDLLGNENFMKRGMPTIAKLKIKESNGDVELEKNKWIGLIEEYDHFLNQDVVHPFFGKITKEQIGYLAYKHTDHHLRQFNS